MSDTVRMRTLTWKSIMGFGCSRQKLETILHLYTHGKAENIINSYFGLSKINYTEDILEAVGITKELRIEKPSKIECYEDRHELFIKAAINFNKLGDCGYKIHEKKIMSQASRDFKANTSASQRKVKYARSISKKKLQLRNQGK